MQTFRAKTTAEAVAKATKELHISQEMLKVTVKQQPRRGFLGIGHRDAVIAVEKKRVAATPQTVSQPKPHQQVQQGSRQQDQENKQADPAERARQQAAANHQKNVAKMKKAAAKCCSYLVDGLRALGIEATASATSIRAHQLTIELTSEKPAAVIGYHGKRLNALEELAAAFLDYHGIHDPHLTLDINNYRQRRQEAIKRLAADCVTEVIASGQAVFLDPMPARERKQLHQLLEKNDQVKTYSHGREPFRSVVVAPVE